MDISKGYLRLFRQMLEWEWYDNPNVKAIFIHCLLCANNTTKKWRDLELKKGQFVTSYEKLAASNGLTIQQTRTALKQLQITHEIEYQTTNQYTVITVKNYNLYQADNTRKFEADTRPNNKQNGGQVTTTNKNKRDINKLISLSIEERENLKKYILAKKKNVKDADAYIRKLLDNGDIVNLLEKAKRWKQKQEEKLKQDEILRSVQNDGNSQENEEEAKKAMAEAHKKVREIKKKGSKK